MSELILASATGAKVGSVAPAIVNGTATSVQVARDVTVAAGDVIMVTKIGGQWFAVGRLFAAAPAALLNDPPPPPNPPTRSGRFVVAPIETRSFRNGAWRTDRTSVIQGQYGGGGNHTGAAFYGSAALSLAGATVTGASIAVRREAVGAGFVAQTATLWLVTEATRPAGAPTLGASTTGPTMAPGDVNPAFPIPTSWAQSIVDGTAGGIAMFIGGGTPYLVFAGTGDWSPAFSMTINWQR